MDSPEPDPEVAAGLAESLAAAVAAEDAAYWGRTKAAQNKAEAEILSLMRWHWSPGWPAGSPGYHVVSWSAEGNYGPRDMDQDVVARLDDIKKRSGADEVQIGERAGTMQAEFSARSNPRKLKGKKTKSQKRTSAAGRRAAAGLASGTYTWTPTRAHRSIGRRNPAIWDDAETPAWTVYLYVGLNVADKAGYSAADVERITREVLTRKSGTIHGPTKRRHYVGDPSSSYLTQRGIYRDSKYGIIGEDSVQVTIISSGDETFSSLKKRMVYLAERLAGDLAQEMVIVDIRQRGLSKVVMGVGPTVRQSRKVHQRRIRAGAANPAPLRPTLKGVRARAKAVGAKVTKGCPDGWVLRGGCMPRAERYKSIKGLSDRLYRLEWGDYARNPGPTKLLVVNPSRSVGAEILDHPIFKQARKALRRKLTAKEQRELATLIIEQREFDGAEPQSLVKVTVPKGMDVGSTFVGSVGELSHLDYKVRRGQSARKGAWTHESGDHGRKYKTKPAMVAYLPGNRNAPPILVNHAGSDLHFKPSHGIMG